MAKGSLDQKGDLSVAAIAIYGPMLFAVLVPLMRHGLSTHVGFFFLMVFCCIKIAGSALSIDAELTLNASLVEPAAILSTVVLSPLLLALSAMIYPSGYKPASRSAFLRRINIFARVNGLIIVASLAVGIVGGIDSFGSDPTKYDLGKTLIRVAAALACVAWAMLCVVVAAFWRERPYLPPFYRLLYPVAAFWALPLFVVRLVYSVGVAATIHTDHTQIFSPFDGSWVLYLCIAWLPEVLISGALTVVGVLWSK